MLAYMTFPPQHRTKLHSTDEMDKWFFVTAAMAIAEIACVHSFVRPSRAILPSRPPISQPPRAGSVKAGRVCGHREAWP
ncbi:hypothetical protein GGD62_006324 [Bradyrhizobium sp. ERR14]|nr:hypothetical protein [Bradyrhizobium sp. ERR14]